MGIRNLVLFCIAFLPAFAMAADPTEMLECMNQPFGGGQGTVQVFLDSNTFTPGSGLKAAVSAQINYEFSSTGKMVCDGTVRGDEFDINCVGYYYVRDVTELKIRVVAGKTVAFWQTSTAYGRRSMQTECVLKALSSD
jgi:hypothetical protein